MAFPGGRRARLSDSDAAQESGFSLVELLVVMLIIGILAAIAIPIFLSQKKNAADAQAKADIHGVAIAEESYLADFQTYLPEDTFTAASVPPAFTAEGFRMSSKTLNVKVLTYGAGATTGGSVSLMPAAGYCVILTSGSNNVFYSASFYGGITTTPCT